MKLLERYGTPEAEGNSISVRGISKDAAGYYEIVSDLVGAGYKVSFFEVGGEDLEQYFLDLVEN